MATREGEDTRVTLAVWAAALILGGLGLLLFTMGSFERFEPVIQYVVSALLLLAAIGFFVGYLSARGHWWRLIPGWTLLALASIVYLTTVPRLDRIVAAALLFLGQSLAFAHIYLLDRLERWWAVIPGGFMLVLGAVIALSSRTQDPDILGTTLFVGMGVVFFLLYLLGQRRRHWWALIPGTVLVLFGFFLFAVERTEQIALLRWWPITLILLGLLLGWRAYSVRRTHRLGVQSASNLHRHGVARSGTPEARTPRLGQYSGPAPGASVDLLSEADDS